MPNTSATGGYLSPSVTTPPLEDDALDAEFQKAVAGITGLEGAMVRPRWQPGNPKQPEATTDWCAIGIATQTPDATPHIQHSGAGDGKDTLKRHEAIKVLCTFYGPNSKRNAATMRDGIQMPQNLDLLALVNIGLTNVGEIQAVPELVNQQWIKRYDLPLFFSRQIVRDYSVLNILSADPILISDEIGIITN
jgi:hypothetical protein